jgi:hypothetical protein
MDLMELVLNLPLKTILTSKDSTFATTTSEVRALSHTMASMLDPRTEKFKASPQLSYKAVLSHPTHGFFRPFDQISSNYHKSCYLKNFHLDFFYFFLEILQRVKQLQRLLKLKKYIIDC